MAQQTDQEKLDAIYTQWDVLNTAIQRILVAQPDQMSDRAARLEAERSKMFEVILGRVR